MTLRKQTLTIEHNGETLYGQIAKIDSTTLGVEDHGVMSAMIHCSWSGGGIGIGGYTLDEPRRDDEGAFSGRFGSGYGLDQIMRILETAGVERWERLPGTRIIVLFETEHPLGSCAVGFASLLDDKVLIFREHADEWRGGA